MSKIVDFRTQHLAEMKVLLDILKENSYEYKFYVSMEIPDDESKKNKRSSDSDSLDEEHNKNIKKHKGNSREE